MTTHVTFVKDWYSFRASVRARRGTTTIAREGDEFSQRRNVRSVGFRSLIQVVQSNKIDFKIEF